MCRSRKIMMAACVIGIGLTFLFVSSEMNSQPPGKGKKGQFNDPSFIADRDVFHELLDHRKSIRRTVKPLANGVETLTESDSPAVAKKIQEHVDAMHKRVTEGRGIHLRDPLFAELFRHHRQITMAVVKTEKGAKVTETSSDPHVAKLIQAHAEVVSRFIENGYEEVHRNHAVPSVKSDLAHPIIKGAGGIVPLPKAVEQPRKGLKLVFDVTSGGGPSEVNKGLERAARLLNLYGTAGLGASDVTIAVVLHGEAAKSSLDDVHYAKRFGIEANPNLALLSELDKAGVEVVVCGQSLHAKGFAMDEVARPIRIALSAMTAVSNRQADGFVYFPVP